MRNDLLEKETKVGYSQPPAICFSGFSNEEIQLTNNSKRLLAVTILLSHRCNLNCVYCYTDAGTSEKEKLSLHDWEKYLIQVKELGARNVWIPGAGEPMLDKVFYNGNEFPLLDLCKSLNLSVTFFSNGTYFTKENLYKLKDYEVSVITKLNSFRADVQDQMAGRKGAHTKIWKGLELLMKAGYNKGARTRLGIDTVITLQNLNEIEDIFIFGRENNIIPYITANLHGGRASYNTNFDVSKEQLKSVFYNLLKIDRTKYGYSWYPSPPVVAGQCKRLLYDLVIGNNSNVQICPGIDISIGNLKNNSLKEILSDSELFDRIRNMSKNLKGKCASCKSKDCVYGCRLEAFSVNNDLFGEDPMCWH